MRGSDLTLIHMVKEHHLELFRVNTMNQMKTCVKILGNAFMIGLKTRCCEKTGNKRRRARMALGDNRKRAVPLSNDENSEGNKNIRLNRFGEGAGTDFTCNVAEREIIFCILHNHFEVNDDT